MSLAGNGAPVAGSSTVSVLYDKSCLKRGTTSRESLLGILFSVVIKIGIFKSNGKWQQERTSPIIQYL